MPVDDATIIACAMLEDEVLAAAQSVGCTAPITWLDRGLHDTPKILRQALQDAVDATTTSTILLSYGLCGNGTLGVRSERARLVMPRVHDCIRLFLDDTPDVTPTTRPDVLYYTAGWLRSRKGLAGQFRDVAEKRGEAKARRVFDKMLVNYQGVGLVNTGSFELEPARQAAQDIAQLFRLEYQEQSGTIRLLQRLFAGQWDEEFLVLAPGDPVELDAFLPARTSRDGRSSAPEPLPPGGNS